jgi:hypothetical protein
MNGRCETDPLDRAEDVCESCYGEYCRACLIYLPGRRHPYCTECALAISRVRGRARPQERGSRRTAKQRRAALAAAGTGDEHRFRFFDDPGRQASGPAEHVPLLAPSTADRVEDRRPAGPIEPAVAAAGAEPLEPSAGGSSGPEPSEAPPGGDLVPVTGPTTPAMAKLSELRRQGGRQPGEMPGDGVHPPGGAPGDGVHPPGGAPGDGVHPLGEAPGQGGAASQPPRRRATDGPGPATSEHRAAEPAGAGPAGDQCLTAPTIGGMHQIGRRSDDVVDDDDDDDGRAEPAKQRHDTDASGNWIPPILRGLAPDARQAKVNLPRRRPREG